MWLHVDCNEVVLAIIEIIKLCLSIKPIELYDVTVRTKVNSNERNLERIHCLWHFHGDLSDDVFMRSTKRSNVL